MSDLIAAAFAKRAELRADYELVLEHQIDTAELITRGNLVNTRGIAAGVTPRDLWTHNATYAHAYASEELIEHWRTTDRMTFADYSWPAAAAVRCLEV